MLYTGSCYPFQRSPQLLHEYELEGELFAAVVSRQLS